MRPIGRTSLTAYATPFLRLHICNFSCMSTRSNVVCFLAFCFSFWFLCRFIKEQMDLSFCVMRYNPKKSIFYNLQLKALSSMKCFKRDAQSFGRDIPERCCSTNVAQLKWFQCSESGWKGHTLHYYLTEMFQVFHKTAHRNFKLHSLWTLRNLFYYKMDVHFKAYMHGRWN